MYARPWQNVNEFYLDVVNGRQSLSQLFGKEVGIFNVSKFEYLLKSLCWCFCFNISFSNTG